MASYTEQEYIDKFGKQMWEDKVLSTLDDDAKKRGVESVYATDAGNIFMIMTREEL